MRLNLIYTIALILVSVLSGKEINGPLDGTLKKSDSPFYVTKEISVLPGTLLKIEPGVVIKFDTTAKFLVEGELKAIGTKENPIEFIPSKKNPTAAAWEGIQFTNRGSDNSRIENCKIKFARRGISVFSVSPVIANNSITNSLYDGIKLSVSKSQIVGNVISSNGSDGINAVQFNGKIKNNIITANNDDGIQLEKSICTVTNNMIKENKDDGIFVLGGDSEIKNNYIIKNGDDAILLGETSSLVFNNLLAKNDFGIFIYKKSYPLIINCTIVNNKYGLFARDNSKLNVENTILWNNEKQIMTDSTGSYSIIYSDVEEKTEGKGNFKETPLFIDYEKFKIKENSPTVGKGNSEASYTEKGVIKVNIGAQIK